MRIAEEIGPRPDFALLSVDLPSHIALKTKVIDLLLSTVAMYGTIDEEVERWLRLALEELVTNAIIHGHEGDPTFLIAVQLWHDDELWHIRLDDQGDGFTPDCVPDPNDPESLFLERGRGITIATHGVRGLHYYRGGRAVVVSFDPFSPPPEDS